MGCNRTPTEKEAKEIHEAATRVVSEVGGASTARAEQLVATYGEWRAKAILREEQQSHQQAWSCSWGSSNSSWSTSPQAFSFEQPVWASHSNWQQEADRQRENAEQQRAEQQRAEQQRAEQQRAEQQRAEQQRAEQQRAEQQRTLVGNNTQQFRRDAQALIYGDGGGSHPLAFLLGPDRKFKPQSGLTEHATLADHPELVQMMHVTSKKTGEPERIVLGTAFNNQWDNVTIEAPHKGGSAVNVVIDIGGIGVELRSAKDWVLAGWLSKEVVDSAPRIDLSSES